MPTAPSRRVISLAASSREFPGAGFKSVKYTVVLLGLRDRVDGGLRSTPFSPAVAVGSLEMRPLATCFGASYGSRAPR